MHALARPNRGPRPHPVLSEAMLKARMHVSTALWHAQVRFIACTSQTYGGALYGFDITSGAALTHIQVERVSFEDCSAGEHGGGFYAAYCAVEARQLSFEGCTAGALLPRVPRAPSPE